MLIISMHAFLPHVHGAEQSQVLLLNETEQPSTDLLQLLGDIFELDLGEGHLEHLTQDGEESWGTEFSLPLLLPPTLLSNSPTDLANKRTATLGIPTEDFLPDDYHSAQPTLRGPPLLA